MAYLLKDNKLERLFTGQTIIAFLEVASSSLVLTVFF